MKAKKRAKKLEGVILRAWGIKVGQSNVHTAAQVLLEIEIAIREAETAMRERAAEVVATGGQSVNWPLEEAIVHGPNIALANAILALE